jgi:hypothetical protein
LNSFLPNAVRLVPMYFGSVYCAIVELHGCESFAFPPATFAVSLAQASEVIDRSACRYGLGVGDPSDDLEVNRECIKSASPTKLKQQENQLRRVSVSSVLELTYVPIVSNQNAGRQLSTR